MTAERVRELLKRYNTNRSRHDHLETEIAETEREYEKLRRELIESEASPRAQVISDMPRASVGVSDKVGDLAVKIADGWKPPELNWMLRRIADMADEMETARLEMKYVEAWLRVLSPRELMVITEHCINGRVWRETAVLFNAEFGEDYSRMGLKAIMNRGLDKIEMVAR